MVKPNARCASHLLSGRFSVALNAAHMARNLSCVRSPPTRQHTNIDAPICRRVNTPATRNAPTHRRANMPRQCAGAPAHTRPRADVPVRPTCRRRYSAPSGGCADMPPLPIRPRTYVLRIPHTPGARFMIYSFSLFCNITYFCI